MILEILKSDWREYVGTVLAWGLGIVLGIGFAWLLGPLTFGLPALLMISAPLVSVLGVMLHSEVRKRKRRTHKP